MHNHFRKHSLFFSFSSLILVMRKYVWFLDGENFRLVPKYTYMNVCASVRLLVTAHVNLPQHALSRAKFNAKHIDSKHTHHTNFEAIEDCSVWPFPPSPHPKIVFTVGIVYTFAPRDIVLWAKKRRRWNLQFSKGKFINGMYVKGIIKHTQFYFFMIRSIRTSLYSSYKWWWIT